MYFGRDEAYLFRYFMLVSILQWSSIQVIWGGKIEIFNIMRLPNHGVKVITRQPHVVRRRSRVLWKDNNLEITLGRLKWPPLNWEAVIFSVEAKRGRKNTWRFTSSCCWWYQSRRMSIVEHRSIHPTYIYDIDDRFGTLDGIISSLITITAIFYKRVVINLCTNHWQFKNGCYYPTIHICCSLLVGVLGEG